MFRYDKDGDRAVTYDEFVNFTFKVGELCCRAALRRAGHSKASQKWSLFKGQGKDNESRRVRNHLKRKPKTYCVSRQQTIIRAFVQ